MSRRRPSRSRLPQLLRSPDGSHSLSPRSRPLTLRMLHRILQQLFRCPLLRRLQQAPPRQTPLYLAPRTRVRHRSQWPSVPLLRVRRLSLPYPRASRLRQSSQPRMPPLRSLPPLRELRRLSLLAKRLSLLQRLRPPKPLLRSPFLGRRSHGPPFCIRATLQLRPQSRASLCQTSSASRSPPLRVAVLLQRQASPSLPRTATSSYI